MGAHWSSNMLNKNVNLVDSCQTSLRSVGDITWDTINNKHPTDDLITVRGQNAKFVCGSEAAPLNCPEAAPLNCPEIFGFNAKNSIEFDDELFKYVQKYAEMTQYFICHNEDMKKAIEKIKSNIENMQFETDDECEEFRKYWIDNFNKKFEIEVYLGQKDDMEKILDKIIELSCNDGKLNKTKLSNIVDLIYNSLCGNIPQYSNINLNFRNEIQQTETFIANPTQINKIEFFLFALLIALSIYALLKYRCKLLKLKK